MVGLCEGSRNDEDNVRQAVGACDVLRGGLLVWMSCRAERAGLLSGWLLLAWSSLLRSAHCSAADHSRRAHIQLRTAAEDSGHTRRAARSNVQACSELII